MESAEVELLHLTARMSVEWMFYCLMEGTLLAAFAWILLRLLPRQNSGTRFALWFSVLVAITVLPFVAGTFFRAAASETFSNSIATSHRFITFSDSVALAVFAIWALVAGLGLVRVAVGLWQVHRIRKNSQEVDPSRLDPRVATLFKDFSRAVSLRVSDRIQVPAAIGLIKPAVVIPRWLVDEISPAELEQVLLHELAHLRRRDDWTNLAQKVVKAVVFFHPSVWWLEQRLSLEREMACDEAVLARSGTPHAYAQCLTRLAEKSMIKKRIALAQAVVSKMRQLSHRVAQILDSDRPRNTRIWKPAVPIVMVAATLCGVSAWTAPVLVAFHNDSPAVRSFALPPLSVRPVNAELNLRAAPPKMVPLTASTNQLPQPRAIASQLPRHISQTCTVASRMPRHIPQHTPQPHILQTSMVAGNAAPMPLQAKQPSGDYVVRSEQFIVTMTQGRQVGHVVMWQVSLWQVRILAPAGNQTGKTVPRKNI